MILMTKEVSVWGVVAFGEMENTCIRRTVKFLKIYARPREHTPSQYETQAVSV